MSETRRVGVTGAAGYIGSRVTAILLGAGHDVVPIDDFSEGGVARVRGVAVRECDVRDRDAVREEFNDVEAVLHLAAVSGVQACDEDQENAFDVNVGGTENVAWFCREQGLPLVFPCSMAVIGDPVEFPITASHPRRPRNFYGTTKAMGEEDIHMLARDAFPAHVYLKSNLYGHHEIDGRTVGKRTVVNIFVEQALSGESLTVHEPGTQARDFIHVKDVARAYALSLDALFAAGSHEDGATSIPIASGDCRSVLDIAETVKRIVEEERGTAPEIELVENPHGDETVGEDFTVDTGAASERIGFETHHTIEGTIREMVRE